MGQRKNRRRLKNRVPVLGLFLAGLLSAARTPGSDYSPGPTPIGGIEYLFSSGIEFRASLLADHFSEPGCRRTDPADFHHPCRR